MKCVIPGTNIKVLARAIHALAKIGDDMYMQPLKDALSLRTVNMANSAFADFTFHENFFTYYNYGDISDEDASRCKISVRSAMTVFKTPNVLEKQVETCHIKLSPNAEKLIFVMKYRNSIVKTHSLPIIDCNVLKASYNKDNVTNKLAIQPRVLTDVVQNFPQNLLEVTMDVNNERTLVRNYIDENSNITNETRTQLVLGTGEFDNYVIGNNSSITFCLKELRALLHFAEGSNFLVHIHFEQAGRPVIIFLKNVLYEANLVQSTLNPDSDSISENSMPVNRDKLTKKNKSTVNNSKKRQLKRTNNNKNTAKRSKKATNTSEKMINETVSRLLCNSPSVEPETPKCNRKSRIADSVANIEINSCPSTPKMNTQSLSQNESNDYSNMEVDDQVGNEDDDIIPSSPKRQTSKKARIIFQKCFQTTFHPTMLPGHDTILAEDTDEEND